ncbi:MAG TPA: alpha/beta fold hydrolase, partial [Steroidobacteraceae bacterium]|nr:alpha/beta fold hydrolase [Steroidobacteraceae bacterium]
TGRSLGRALLMSACAVWSLSAAGSALATETDHLRVRIEGRGPPTVILEGGLGDTLDVWRDVQPAIAAQCARTLAYNRAGYAGSRPASGHRDAATIVSELRAELRRRGVQPPYVLVGHSLGGLYMQYFARTHADEVSGLVLVDSTHWNQGLPQDQESTAPSTMGRAVMLFVPLIARREFADSTRAGEQVHSSPPAGSVPTIVLSRTQALRGEAPAARTESARLQNEIVADFPAARHVNVSGSGHYIQRDRPDAVIGAARELAGCSATNETNQTIQTIQTNQ